MMIDAKAAEAAQKAALIAGMAGHGARGAPASPGLGAGGEPRQMPGVAPQGHQGPGTE